MPNLEFVAEPGRYRVYARMIKRFAESTGYPKQAEDSILGMTKQEVTTLLPGAKFRGEVIGGVPEQGAAPSDIFRQAVDEPEPTDPIVLSGGKPETPIVPDAAGTDEWPGGVPEGPVPARLGRPAGSPYGKANWDAFSTNEHVSQYVKQLADDYTDIDAYVPESRAEALEFAQRDYERLNDIIGERSSVNINELFDNMGTQDIRRITYRLMAMRQLAADMGSRIYEIAAKGTAASPTELYEFIRGRRLVEAIRFPRVNDDLSALCDKRGRNRSADACRRAGHVRAAGTHRVPRAALCSHLPSALCPHSSVCHAIRDATL